MERDAGRRKNGEGHRIQVGLNSAVVLTPVKGSEVTAKNRLSHEAGDAFVRVDWDVTNQPHTEEQRLGDRPE